MQKKIVAILLAGMMCGSLAACSGTTPVKNPDSAASSKITSSAAVSSAATSTTESTKDSGKKAAAYSVPDSVAKLNEEEEKAIAGTLEGDVYRNSYFGFKLTAPEGWVLSNEDFGDEDIDPMSLKQMSEKGYGAVFISADSKDESVEESISLLIQPCEEKEAGLDARALAEQERSDLEKTFSDFGFKNMVLEVRDMTFAGEKRPVVFLSMVYGNEEMEEYHLFLPKNDFYAKVLLSGTAGKTEELLQAFDKE